MGASTISQKMSSWDSVQRTKATPAHSIHYQMLVCRDVNANRRRTETEMNKLSRRQQAACVRSRDAARRTCVEFWQLSYFRPYFFDRRFLFSFTVDLSIRKFPVSCLL